MARQQTETRFQPRFSTGEAVARTSMGMDIYGQRRAGFILVVICLHVKVARSSVGDRSARYQACLHDNIRLKCGTSERIAEFAAEQPLTERLLSWSCEDDCKYRCMWEAVEAFKSADLQVPQFHGKWPFVRIFGVQEPASMIFSLFNAYTHVLGLRLYLSQIDSTTPLYYPSILFSIVSIHAWCWSAIFHTRDFPFTEMMDYFSATAGVFYSIYYCVFRISLGLVMPSPRRGKTIRKATAVLLVFIYIRHVSQLLRFFDYGYNMLVNVIAGLANGALWIAYHFLTRRVFSHQWMATLAVLTTMGLLSLELLDFKPIFWVFDAHSMWHLGTVFFPFIWYPFMVQESRICCTKLVTR